MLSPLLTVEEDDKEQEPIKVWSWHKLTAREASSTEMVTSGEDNGEAGTVSTSDSSTNNSVPNEKGEISSNSGSVVTPVSSFFEDTEEKRLLLSNNGEQRCEV